MKPLTLNHYTCLRCGHEWPPRKAKLPKWCPKCKSPYWDKPRRTLAPFTRTV